MRSNKKKIKKRVFTVDATQETNCLKMVITHRIINTEINFKDKYNIQETLGKTLIT